MKTRYFHWSLLLLAIATVLGSCSDWLDVKPESEEREKDLFTSYQGFKDALAGCYSTMAGTDLYGERLTMTDIEDLACLWAAPKQTSRPEDYYFYNHMYTATESEAAIKAIYGGLFNVVAQANKILEHVNNGAITDPDARNVMQGEALALRAWCQFDVLRLFGQIPQNAKNSIKLPYSMQADIHSLATYYGFDDYVKLLRADLSRADSLLKISDPILKYSVSSLNEEGNDPVAFEDDYMTYRQFRLNYFAVKGLEARLALYIGDRATAYKEAMGVINAKVNGQPFMSLSGTADLGKNNNGTIVSYGTLPDECVFALSNRKLADYAFTTLGGGTRVDENSMLYITTDMLNKQLYNGRNTTSDNRYLYVWNRSSVNYSNITRPTLTKYYYNTSDYSDASSYHTLLTKIQIMPMLRMSELYLIAIESTDDLAEANSLYKTYMASHNVNITDNFTSLQAVKDELEYEYTREFYGEGQAFYAYKRMGVQWMLLGGGMSEADYELPLPNTEFDPNATTESSTK